MDEKALEALHVAAAAIRKMKGVKECTAENDNKSGEIFFSLKTGGSYILKLAEDEEAKDQDNLSVGRPV